MARLVIKILERPPRKKKRTSIGRNATPLNKSKRRNHKPYRSQGR